MVRTFLFALILAMSALSSTAQMPPVEPGVSHELAKWRAAHYSDVRYKLNLTLEKMSPVLKGTMEIRLNVWQLPRGTSFSGGLKVAEPGPEPMPPIVLDWRKIRGHEEKSTISNIVVNGKTAKYLREGIAPLGAPQYHEPNEHLVILGGVVAGENVVKLDFTSPILTSGSAITRYVDKEDGAEYIYSLFVPSDASTAFPVFDQPDLKARFQLEIDAPYEWEVISNSPSKVLDDTIERHYRVGRPEDKAFDTVAFRKHGLEETIPISTYVFAFAAGPFEQIKGGNPSGSEGVKTPKRKNTLPTGRVSASDAIYVRKSQAAKFKPHAAEMFRLNREAIKYFEDYFDYKFPFPKYDLVLIPEFPFGGMEHAGATFLRESAIIFPQEPTKNDHISRAVLIFHEAAHQWFGDTVTMRWFDDLWLKEGFANFAAYKAMEKIMPEANAWKVFYERIKQGAYQTDSTKGTTPIYQEIKNLSAAKSAYGNIVYNKAPAFLRQAEFYLGEDKFQTAVRAFLKKHEFGNAGWEDLVKEFERASDQVLKDWGSSWVKQRGMTLFKSERHLDWFDIHDPKKEKKPLIAITPSDILGGEGVWTVKAKSLLKYRDGTSDLVDRDFKRSDADTFGGRAVNFRKSEEPLFVFPNYQDYGYGIFLLDEKSRDYVLKNIQNEKDPFLRSMIWGALWDSVREGELDPREYVRLVVTILGSPAYRRPPQDDESTIALLLSRVGTAMNYYLELPPTQRVRLPKSVSDDGVPTGIGSNDLHTGIETMLMGEMQRTGSLTRRLTFYRAFLNIASSQNARDYLKQILAGDTAGRSDEIPLKTKDKFDIVTRLLILGDVDAPKLLAKLEKTETSDEAKRYAYAAKAGIPTTENKAKYWNDFVNNKEISESWIEAAFGPFNSIRHSELTLPYLQKALQELPNHKRSRKIFFVNGWLGAFIGGQRSEEALNIVNKFLADPNLDKDLRLKILENVDVIERAVNIRSKFVPR